MEIYMDMVMYIYIYLYKWRYHGYIRVYHDVTVLFHSIWYTMIHYDIHDTSCYPQYISIWFNYIHNISNSCSVVYIYIYHNLLIYLPLSRLSSWNIPKKLWETPNLALETGRSPLVGWDINTCYMYIYIYIHQGWNIMIWWYTKKYMDTRMI